MTLEAIVSNGPTEYIVACIQEAEDKYSDEAQLLRLAQLEWQNPRYRNKKHEDIGDDVRRRVGNEEVSDINVTPEIRW